MEHGVKADDIRCFKNGQIHDQYIIKYIVGRI